MAPFGYTKSALDGNMERIKDDGFFLPSRRSVTPGQCYLIVSCGGAGTNVLFAAKKKLEQVLAPGDRNSHVQLLAVDTDIAAQTLVKRRICADGHSEQVVMDSLSEANFALLSGANAQAQIDSSSCVNAWMNPRLPGMIRKDIPPLRSSGANCIRQLGRASMYPSDSRMSLTAKIHSLISMLSLGSPHASLEVYILSSISGGTGSGAVIDLTYLIRDVIRRECSNIVPGKIRYTGFVLLPSTGNAADAYDLMRGNCNGYAALKEINHFMTMHDHSGTYSMTYSDGAKVESRENLFDTCYLFDGDNDEFIFSDSSRWIASSLSDCLVDRITASINYTDSPLIRVQSETDAPRNADYIYCTLGHSDLSMPANEIKAYVARNMFLAIYNHLKNCSFVSEADAEAFIKDVIHSDDKSHSALDNRLHALACGILTSEQFKCCGPWCLIRLLNKVCDIIPQKKLKWRLFIRNDDLEYIAEWCLHMSRGVFQDYTVIMDCMMTMLNDQYNQVVSATNTGYHYSFFPDFLDDDNRRGAVLSYLDGLVKPEILTRILRILVHELVENPDWLHLNNRIAADAMCKFWDKCLDGILDTSMENLLIRYYSCNAGPDDSGDHHDEALAYLEIAAKDIYRYFLDKTATIKPMANFICSGISPRALNTATGILVPFSAPVLLRALTGLASSDMNNKIRVCPYTAANRIVCWMQYTSIPAFKLNWVWKAERDYENLLLSSASIGLHLSEAPGEAPWRDLPNLLPATIWHLSPGYCNDREKMLASHAEDLFRRADRVCLTEAKPTAAGIIEYSVKLLPEPLRPDKENTALSARKCATDIYRALLQANNGLCPRGALVPAIEKAYGSLKTVDLNFSGRNLLFTPHHDWRSEGWDAMIAAGNLRKLPDIMAELEDSLTVLELLQSEFGFG